jgi:hypothetical protein
VDYVIKINHKHFAMDYDMLNVIKDNYKHFDMECDMKTNYKFQVLIFCNAS